MIRCRMEVGTQDVEGLTQCHGSDGQGSALRHSLHADRLRVVTYITEQHLKRSGHSCQHRVPALHSEASELGRGLWDVY